ncbi:hypothetical protein F4778DRAFT_762279 [Xylariomycetidae sp. FL2044]|nr:hypothetical protein F4778DRAFT_762279 [Xylariomycetidae sp. FL2044]
MVAIATVTKFARDLGKIRCQSRHGIKLGISSSNVVYEHVLEPDIGTAEYNFDNFEIASLISTTDHIVNKVWPMRRETVQERLYTNNKEFAIRMYQFDVLVLVSAKPDLLDFLSKAAQLKYSPKKQAFVKTNLLGMTTKVYKVSPQRYALVRAFVRGVRLCAQRGVRIHWKSRAPSKQNEEARAKFLNQPSPLAPPLPQEYSFEGSLIEENAPTSPTGTLQDRPFEDNDAQDSDYSATFIEDDSEDTWGECVYGW